MPLNKFHEDPARNAYAWGQSLAGAIELALTELGRFTTLDPVSACVIAEAIIEHGAGDDAFRDGVALYAGALDGSPLYQMAEQRKAQRVAA